MAKASDNEFPSVLLVEGTTPTSPAAGRQRIFIDSADHKLKRVNSSGTVTTVEGTGGATFTSYAAFTPALTAVTTNPTLGTGGSVEGRYMQLGTGTNSHVEGDIEIQFGSSGTNAGSGTYRLSLPVAMRTPTLFRLVGSVLMAHSGTTRFGYLGYVSSTTVQILMDSTTGTVASAAPWVWGAGDAIEVHFAYEAA